VQKDFFREDKFNAEENALYYFEIVLRESEEVLFSVPIYPGEEIIYSYVHSSDGTPVQQIFTVKEDGLLHLLEERYSWYGAGLEFGSGYNFSFTDNEVRVSGYDRSFSTLLIRAARTVPQEFLIRDTRVLLSDLVPGGTPLMLRIQRLNNP
jgi:hypothetical protein